MFASLVTTFCDRNLSGDVRLIFRAFSLKDLRSRRSSAAFWGTTCLVPGWGIQFIASVWTVGPRCRAKYFMYISAHLNIFLYVYQNDLEWMAENNDDRRALALPAFILLCLKDCLSTALRLFDMLFNVSLSLQRPTTCVLLQSFPGLSNWSSRWTSLHFTF